MDGSGGVLAPGDDEGGLAAEQGLVLPLLYGKHRAGQHRPQQGIAPGVDGGELLEGRKLLPAGRVDGRQGELGHLDLPSFFFGSSTTSTALPLATSTSIGAPDTTAPAGKPAAATSNLYFFSAISCVLRPFAGLKGLS